MIGDIVDGDRLMEERLWSEGIVRVGKNRWVELTGKESDEYRALMLCIRSKVSDSGVLVGVVREISDVTKYMKYVR